MQSLRLCRYCARREALLQSYGGPLGLCPICQANKEHQLSPLTVAPLKQYEREEYDHAPQVKAKHQV